ncbi:MAG: hypothetical protein JWO06_171 [Bacteroidota bacterium]|nr:hypothetical protein [Bacteroidota bacterium]
MGKTTEAFCSVKHFELQNIDYCNVYDISIVNHKLFNETGIMRGPQVMMSMGHLEVEDFRINKGVAFAKLLWPDSVPDEKFWEVLHNQLVYFQTCVAMFYTYLWFVKDNSVCGGTVYGKVLTSEGEEFDYLTCPDNITNSAGLQERVSFTADELSSCIDIANKYQSLYPRESLEMRFLKKANPKNHLNRIDRAMEFLLEMRRVQPLTYKVAMCGPIFESLFSTDIEAVSHKIGERVAYYIGENEQDRIDIYDTVKAMYSVRSRFFHGDVIENKHLRWPTITELSKRTDEILRRALTKVIREDSLIFSRPKDDIPDQGIEGLNTFFKNLIFPKPKDLTK